MSSNRFQILLIEDNPADADLTQEALEAGKILHDLHMVEDGVQAMAFLHQTGEYSQVPRPDLILLDLNLPGKDGREVLAEIKANESLKTIPVVILTTSQAEEDILITYKLQANCFITKPVGLNDFFKIIQRIEEFWFLIVKLPSK